MGVICMGTLRRSSDGNLRELRLLRFGIAGGRDREPAQVAIAAYVTAMGGKGIKPEPWSQRFRVAAQTAADYVRVVEVGLVDGSEATLFARSASEAEALYREHGESERAVRRSSNRPLITVCRCKFPDGAAAGCRLADSGQSGQGLGRWSAAPPRFRLNWAPVLSPQRSSFMPACLAAQLVLGSRPFGDRRRRKVSESAVMMTR